MNESPGEIVQCERCRRYLALESGWEVTGPDGPMTAEDIDADEEEPVTPLPRKRRVPLAGLSVLW